MPGSVEFIDGLNNRQENEVREIVREEMERRDEPVSPQCAGLALKPTKRGPQWVRPGEGHKLDEGELLVLERSGDDLIERRFESAEEDAGRLRERTGRMTGEIRVTKRQRLTTSTHAAAMLLDCHGEVSALGDRLTCGKMHGLVYIAQETYLRWSGRTLVWDQPAARRIGPVFPELEAVIGSGMRETAGLGRLEHVLDGVPADGERDFFLGICNRWKNWSAEGVMRELRRRGTPWHEARWRGRILIPRPDAIISDDLIKAGPQVVVYDKWLGIIPTG